MAGRKPPTWALPRKEPEAGDESGSLSVDLDLDLHSFHIIRQHRELLGNGTKSSNGNRFPPGIMQFLDPTGIYGPPPPPHSATLQESVPPGLEPILVKEIDRAVDKVYENRVLLLTLIEDPMDGCNQTTFIGRDQEGKALEVFVTDLPQTEEFHELLAFGTQIGIINPFHRVGVHGNFIEVDSPDKVIRLGRKTEMCRYCGEENSPVRCTNCKATYCSRKCQVADWKELNHKMICKVSSA